MSRLWPDVSRFRVHLGGRQLVACELRGVLRPLRVARKAIFTVEPGHLGVALQSLRAWMEDSRSKSATQAWTLGVAEVRYMLMDWTSELADERLRLLAVLALFEQQFHETAERFTVRTSWSARSQPILVALMERSVLAEIEAHAQATRVRLTRVEPSLAAVWNRFESRLARESGDLVITEAYRQLVLRHEGRAFRNLAFRPFNIQDAAPIAVLGTGACASMISETGLAGARQRCVLALRDGLGFQSTEDALFAPALCRDF